MLKNILTFTVLSFLIAGCASDRATVEEKRKAIATYPFSDPDPTPRPERNYYPYFRFDGYSHTSDSVEWTVVELENKYIKVAVFPEIGGKVWGAVEKSTGNDFIYNNSVVKFRNIAMRGPWTSGGIEFNFGILGHVPTTATPVDYRTVENNDGSVSCFVGATDLMTRTRWEAEINLQPDKAYFTTEIKWHNPTPFTQPYYQWCNAAFHAQGGLQMIFPGNHRMAHDGILYSWPIDEQGMDKSLYANNKKESESNHIIGSTDGFYAAYWHDLGFGSGNFSLYGDKLGKKLFFWSQNRSGGIWEDLLTDNDGQYVEFQTGRLFNQANEQSTLSPFKHKGFFPSSTDDFKEYWFPVMGIGGVLKANEAGAINVIKHPDSQLVLLSPLQRIKGDVNIYAGERLIYSERIRVAPLEMWEVEIPLNKAGEPLKIVVGNDKLLVYQENEAPISRPVKAPADFDWNSVYGLYLSGMNWLYQNDYPQALRDMQACLEKDPLYAPALNMIAELYLKQYDLANASLYAGKSLSIDTYDPMANYIAGLAAKYQGNFNDAQDGFAVAALSEPYRNAAYTQMAKLFILKDELHRARQYAERIVDHDSKNEDALLLLSIISRKSGNVKDAVAYAGKLEKISPLNHFSRFERLMAKESESNKDNFVSMIRSELPYQTYMEMAHWYGELGCRDEAVRLLEMSPETALVNLNLSSLYDKMGEKQKSDHYFARALGNPIEYNYPFRTEEFPLLRWAVAKTDNWKPKYYLGLLNWRYGDLAQAKRLFSECGQLPESPYFYFGKAGLLRADKTYDPEPDLLRAKELNPDNWRTYRALAEYYLDQGQAVEALAVAKDASGKFPQNEIIRVDYARSLSANGRYSECLDMLDNTVILPNEGARYGKIIYREAAVLEGLGYLKDNKIDQALRSIGIARTWPENLGVGRHYYVDERIEDFLEAECMLKLNEPGHANELYRKIIDFRDDRDDKHRPCDYLCVIALRRLGRDREAREFLARWKKESPDDPTLMWLDGKTSSVQPHDPDSHFELLKKVLSQI